MRAITSLVAVAAKSCAKQSNLPVERGVVKFPGFPNVPGSSFGTLRKFGSTRVHRAWDVWEKQTEE